MCTTSTFTTQQLNDQTGLRHHHQQCDASAYSVFTLFTPYWLQVTTHKLIILFSHFSTFSNSPPYFSPHPISPHLLNLILDKHHTQHDKHKLNNHLLFQKIRTSISQKDGKNSRIVILGLMSWLMYGCKWYWLFASVWVGEVINGEGKSW